MFKGMNRKVKINDNVLVALTLMTAKSLPRQKDTVVVFDTSFFARIVTMFILKY